MLRRPLFHAARLAAPLIAPLIGGALLRAPLAWAAADAPRLGDESTLEQLARIWVEHGVYVGDWPPGYPWLLKLLLDTSGEAWLNVARGLNVAASVLGVGATMLLGAVVGGRRTALVSGWIAALFLSQAVWGALLYTEALCVTLLTLAYGLAARGLLAPRWARSSSLAAGALVGVASYLRAAGLVVLAGLAGGLACATYLLARREALPWTRATVAAVVAGLRPVCAALLVLLPLALHNAEIAGHSAWLSPTGSNNVVLGWGGVVIPFERVGLPEEQVYAAPLGDLRKRLEAPGPVFQTPEMDAHAGDPSEWARARVVSVVREHPGWAVRSRIVQLSETLAPVSFLHRALRLGQLEPLTAWRPFGFLIGLAAVLGSLAVMWGAAIALLRGGGPLGWWCLAGGITAANLLVPLAMFGISRFRAPLEPLWIVAAALAFERSTAGGGRRVTGLLVLLSLAALHAVALPVTWTALSVLR